MQPATLLTFVVLILIALLHLLRLILGVEVTVSGALVPIWLSVAPTLFFGVLALGLWRDHVTPRPPVV
jgi:uncharacterized protein YhhL (DUF1145 family)